MAKRVRKTTITVSLPTTMDEVRKLFTEKQILGMINDSIIIGAQAEARRRFAAAPFKPLKPRRRGAVKKGRK